MPLADAYIDRIEFLKYLPGTDCGDCGAVTCEAFVAGLKAGRNKAGDCPGVGQDLYYPFQIALQAEGKVRFDQRLRLDLDWQDALDRNRLNHFLDLAGIHSRKNIETLLLNLGAGEYHEGQFYLNQAGVLFFAMKPTFKP